MELLKTLLHWAKSKQKRVSLNPGMKEIQHQEKLLSLLNFVEILFLNKNEAEALWGIDDKNHGAYVSVITDGERGGKVSVGGKVSAFEGIKVRKVMDTTGAGDAFASGMVAGVLYGKTIEQAVKWGVKNATHVLQYIGAKKGLLTLSEINR